MQCQSLDALQERFDGLFDQLEDNTLAAACYDANTIEELDAAVAGCPDLGECQQWEITPTEWRRQVLLALRVMRAERDFLAAAMAANVALDGIDAMRAARHGVQPGVAAV